MWRRCAETLVVISGLCLLATAGWRVVERAAFQAQPQLVNTLRPGIRILGRLEIPRIGVGVMLVEGADESALSVSAGHVAGTAALGVNGNAVIAGHRDAEFRALRGIRIGDRLRVRADKTYIYVVTRMRVVDADDLTMLEASRRSLLTLVTCYPFRYVGDAPKRFVVQAELAGT